MEVIDQAWMVPRHTLKQHRCQPLPESDSVLYFRQHNQVPKVPIVTVHGPTVNCLPK